MFSLAGLACVLILGRHVHSAPAAATEHRLLGSSFAVPGNQSFDYIVVGGGTAGLAVATRLAEDPSKSVAVIEAGSFYEIGNGNLSQIPAFGPAFGGKSPTAISPLVDWGFLTTPQQGLQNQPTFYARGKCLGGSSGRNYLTYQRGSKGTYKMWAEAVQDPSYEWDQFLPFFEKSLNFTPPQPGKRPANATPEFDASTLTGNGPLSVTFANYAQPFSSWVQKALSNIGINPIKGLTSGNILGSSYQVFTLDATRMTRESSETSFLQKLGLPQSNFIVYQSTLVTRVLFNQNVATGIEIDYGGVTFVLQANKEVILSAGAFQSPQLLMISGIGPAATLQQHGIPVIADRPGVGQNMWDHILGGPSYRVGVTTTSSLTNNPAFAAAATQEYLQDASGPLTDPGADFLAWERLPSGSLPNSTLTSLRSQFPDDWPDVEYVTTSAFYGRQENYLLDPPRDPFNYASIAIAINAPLSRGTVSISSSKMSDPPIINPNWLTHPIDQAVAVAGFKRTRQIFQDNVMQPILLGDEYFPGLNVSTDAQILDFIRQSFGTVFHASCTCKMGATNDSMAVVDSKARVIGAKQLRVVDISAFPLLPPGHPVSTVYALAEKIADDISRTA